MYFKIAEHGFQKNRNYFIAKFKELKVAEFIVIVSKMPPKHFKRICKFIVTQKRKYIIVSLIVKEPATRNFLSLQLTLFSSPHLSLSDIRSSI